MSKIDELRKKYPSVSNAMFDKLVNSDTTATKKYGNYLLKMWDNRKYSGCPSTSSGVINMVKKFDTLLPYIENKDIYSKEYSHFQTLKSVVETAEKVRDEKTFIKEEHVIVYRETDNYIMLQPKTHRGSLKYGSGTKWCTASKDEKIFNNYNNRGLLVYIIRKNLLPNANQNKIAFYLNYDNGPFNGEIDIFIANDSKVHDINLTQQGWDETDLMEIFTIYRQAFIHIRKDKKVKDDINNFIKTISRLDFESLTNNLSKIEHSIDGSYLNNIKEKLDIFLGEIQKTTNIIRKSQNSEI